MSLRLKIILALALLASVATTALGTVLYRTTRAQLLRSVDQSLVASLSRVQDDLRDRGALPVRRPPLGFAVEWQFVGSDGTVIRNSGLDLPVSERDLRLAAATTGAPQAFRNARVEGVSVRILTITARVGGTTGALQVARDLTETQSSLGRIARRTLIAVLIVAGLAILLGWLLGRHITRRLERLTGAAQHVASTGALDLDVPVEGRDEVAALGSSMRSMLGALAASRAAQHQLVQDAGHELRTPLTSLRTNVSVLRRYEGLSSDSRQQLLDDLDSESRELTALVNELVDLATDRRDDEVPQTEVLRTVADRVAERARRRTGREIVVDADDSTASIRVHAFERAVQNLVDNAVKFAPNGPIEISVRRGTVAVRDHGPGLEAGDEDKIFERFYRAVASRSLPGSGLGLSIVRSVADSHGGTVSAANAAGGGALIGIQLPVEPAPLPPPTGAALGR